MTHTMIDACVAGPFSQRVMLTLGEKKVPFRKNFLDEDNLPEWCASRYCHTDTGPLTVRPMVRLSKCRPYRDRL